MALPQMNPPPANTYLEPTAPNVREDLADVIYRIDPDETPLVSAISKVDAEQVLTEWLLQELNVAANVPQPEGFTAAISPSKQPARLNNVCQILARTVGVSDTLRVVNQVGEEEYNRQLVLRGMELRRDLELTITGETVKTISDPRQLSGFQTWVTNGEFGVGGAFPTGDGTKAHTPGAAADLTLDMVNNAMQQAWSCGGKPVMGLMSGSVKRFFTTLSQGGTPGNAIAAQNIVQATTPAPVTIVGAVDVYLSDFGRLELTPDRFMPDHVLEIIDPNFLELAPLPNRDFIDEQYAKTGDNTQGGVVWEGTLRATAPRAHACVWDLNQ